MTPLNKIPGLQIGHAQNLIAATGCTVILTTAGAICGIDQRGGAPGTRETDLLRPMHLVQKVHAVLLAGGSAFGLAAADGVMQWLAERGIGIDTQVAHVPIVPAAVLFDLDIGQSEVYPDAPMGYAACQNAANDNTLTQSKSTSIGAGTGATIGKILGPDAAVKGGIGSAVIEVRPNLFVGALIAVNCFGDVIDPKTGQIIAGARKLPDDGFANTMRVMQQTTGNYISFGNTVIGVVATNASLSKEMVNKMAQMAHNGLARTISPAHTMFDGDTIFALSTGQGESADINLIGAYGVEAVTMAVVEAVQQATSLAGIPARQDL